MWKSAWLVVILSLGCVLAEDTEESDIIELTNETFDKTIDENTLVFIKFYAPWCGHCRRLVPEFEAAARTLHGASVQFGSLDVSSWEDIGLQNDVPNLPTLKLFRDGVPQVYEGEKDDTSMVKFLKKQMEPALKILTSKEDLEAFIPTDVSQGVALVGFLTAYSDDGRFFADFAKVKRNLPGFSFGLASPSLGEANHIVLFKPFDEKRNVFKGELEEEEPLLKFMDANAFQLVGEVTPQNYLAYQKRGYPFAWMFFDTDAKAKEKGLAIFKKLAPDYRQLSFVYIDGLRYLETVTKLGFTGKKFPVFAIETTNSTEQFLFPEDTPVSKEHLKMFFDTNSKRYIQVETSHEEDEVEDEEEEEFEMEDLVENQADDFHDEL